MNQINYLLTQLGKLSSNPNFDITYILNQISKVDNVELLADSISDSQIQSKQWIVEQIKNFNLGKIFICAGWFSTLLFDTRLKFEKCISIDLDPICEQVSKILHKKLVIDSWKFQAVTDNIHNINYSGQHFTISRSDSTTVNMFINPDTIINTSCEHIENFDKWYALIPSDKLLILQTNNGFHIPDHVNCVSRLEEFEKQTPMSTVLYSGEREMSKFTRFMRIGIK
jgi:hypothetical protein